MTDEPQEVDVAVASDAGEQHDTESVNAVANEPSTAKRRTAPRVQRGAQNNEFDSSELLAKLAEQQEAINALKEQLSEQQQARETKQVGLGQAQNYHVPNLVIKPATVDGTISTRAALATYANTVVNLVKQQGGFR